jgi:hypothetical protein
MGVNRSTSLVALLLAAMPACRHSTAPGSLRPATGLRVVACEETRRLAPAVPPPTGSTQLTGLRAHLVGVSRTVPGGFAGIRRLTPTGQIAILLTDTLHTADVRAALREVVRSQPLSLPSADDNITRAPAIQVNWTLAELYDWLWYLESALPPALRAFGGAYTSSGVDDGANRVFFDAPDSLAQAGLLRALAGQSLTCELVTSEVRPYSTADGWPRRP